MEERGSGLAIALNISAVSCKVQAIGPCPGSETNPTAQATPVHDWERYGPTTLQKLAGCTQRALHVVTISGVFVLPIVIAPACFKRSTIRVS